MELESALFTNLTLLGLDRSDPTASAHLVPGIFAAGGANHIKAAEAVLHHLLTRLDAANAKLTFFGCWPALEPRQSNEFRKASFKWIEALRKAGSIPQNVMVRSSDFDQCYGERFVRVLLALSCHVLEMAVRGIQQQQASAMTKRANDQDTDNDDESRVQVEIDQASVRFIEASGQRVRAQQEWYRTASKLQTEYDNIQRDLAAVKRAANEITSKHSKLGLSLNNAGELLSSVVTEMRNTWTHAAGIIALPSQRSDFERVIQSQDTGQSNRSSTASSGQLSDRKLALLVADLRRSALGKLAVSRQSTSVVSTSASPNISAQLIVLDQMRTQQLQRIDELRQCKAKLTAAIESPARSATTSDSMDIENEQSSSIDFGVDDIDRLWDQTQPSTDMAAQLGAHFVNIVSKRKTGQDGDEYDHELQMDEDLEETRLSLTGMDTVETLKPVIEEESRVEMSMSMAVGPDDNLFDVAPPSMFIY
ncbi:hypothetical protein GQ42DRAFT_56563 [Ramicandelaber brevisporus]|nr:hypothetical protein GQ42DRAFT_56563 [Ramicandelaber brevisporus]